MLRRVMPGALAAALLLPVAAEAQTLSSFEPPRPASRVLIAPYGGYIFGVTRSEETFVLTGTDAYFAEHDVELGGGAVVGAVADIRVVGPFSLHAGGAYAKRGQTRHYVSEAPDVYFTQEGSDVLFLKAGIGLHLMESISELQRRSLSGTLFVAPLYMRDSPREEVEHNGETLGESEAWGVNFGFDGQLPITTRVAFQFGAEDYVVWWDEEELTRWADAFWDLSLGQPGATEVSVGASHNFLVRLGLSFTLLQ